MRITLFSLLFYFIAVQVMLGKETQTEKIAKVLQKTIKKNSDKKVKQKKEELKWEIQKALIRSMVLDELRELLKETPLPKEDQQQTLQFADNLVNQSFKSYEKLNKTQQDKVKNIVLDVPKEYKNLKKTDKDLYFEDFKYLLDQDQVVYDKQEILLSLLTTNMSDTINNQKQVSAQEILDNIDGIIQDDKKHPNKTYSIEKKWNLSQFVDDESLRDSYSLDSLSSKMIQEQIFDILNDDDDLSLSDLEDYLDDIFEEGDEDQEDIEEVKDQITSLYKEWTQSKQEEDPNKSNKNDTQVDLNKNNTNSSSSSETSQKNVEEEVKPKKSKEQIFLYFMILCGVMSLLLLVILIGYRKLRRIQISTGVNKDGQIQFDKEIAQDNYY